MSSRLMIRRQRLAARRGKVGLRRPSAIFRPVQTPRAAYLPLAFALAYVSLSLAAYAWTTATGGLALLWLCNGMTAGALLLLPARQGLALWAFGAAIDFSCAIALGHSPIRQAALIASLDAAEGLSAAFLARQVGGAALDVTRSYRLISLMVLAVIPATLTAGTLGALASTLTIGADLGDTWIAWAVGDFLGMSIALPATLLLARAKRFDRTAPNERGRQIVLILGAVVATALVFMQRQVHGLMLAAPMIMLLEAFVVSPAGMAAAMILSAFVASGLTVSGFGPIADDESVDLGRRILALDLVLSAIALSTWFATALVADRDRAKRTLQRTLAVARTARERAADAARSKAAFLANMSHEIRTPLNGVIALAGVLAKTELTPTQGEMIELIRTSGETLESLLSDILDMSKVEAGKLEIELRPIDLTAEVRAAAALMQVRAAEKGLNFDVVVGEGAKGRFLCDPVRLRQIIANLVSNAVKFTDRGGVRVEISGGEMEGEVAAPIVIRVIDSGIGFDAAAGAKLFDRFTQADSSVTRTHGGVGLGLGIVKSLCELLGGAVTAWSTPGLGSTFEVTLPLPRVDSSAASAQETAPPSAPLHDDPGRLRILVADDNPVNRRVAALILEPFGADLTFAENGLEAVEQYQHHDFDLVLMDMQMPLMDGLSATRRIRELERSSGRARTPIAMLSANAMQQHLTEALAAGCDRHIAKPVTPASLVEGINQMLAQPPQVGAIAAA